MIGFSSTMPAASARRAMLAVPLLALLAAAPLAAAATRGSIAPGGAPRATLEQCLTSPVQSERSATFAGEMSSQYVSGTVRMEIRIDVLERTPAQLAYHLVTAPGLGVWRSSAAGVKIFKYLKQVTNLSAPAFYRGVVRFRWLGARGRTIAATQLRTRRCQQPLMAAEQSPPAMGAQPSG